MSLRKNWKVIILLLAMAVQGTIINHLTRGGGDSNVVWQIAGEIPEPGTILLLALGSLWLRNQNRKNREQSKSKQEV